MSHVIPASLIQKAKRLGACQEAIGWLKEQPRTFEELAEYPKWSEWAVFNMATRHARDAYIAARQPALDAYDAATKQAWDAYIAARQPAWDARDAATGQALDAYDAATKQALLAALLSLVEENQ